MIYGANVTRDGQWWMVAVPAIDGLTQARRLSDAERMTRELVAVETGADLADVAVAVRVTVAPDDASELVPEDQESLLTYLQDQVTKSNRATRLRVNADGSATELAPEHCPAGHSLGPNRATVGWQPCGCVPGVFGHRTYHCTTCGAWLYDPPHTES